MYPKWDCYQSYIYYYTGKYRSDKNVVVPYTSRLFKNAYIMYTLFNYSRVLQLNKCQKHQILK